MELKKSNSANLERFKTLFLVISFIISLSVVYYVFNVESMAAETVEFNRNGNIEDEEIVPITQREQEPEPPEPEPAEQELVVEEIILKENDAIITETWEVNNEFGEDDEVNLDETMGEEDEEIFVYAEHMPEFPGGVNALRTYISKNITYPVIAQENGIQGTVYLRFEVKKTGKIGKVEIQKGADPLLNEEAKKVVQSLPAFKPGSQNGKAVAVWYSLPVVFKLAN